MLRISLSDDAWRYFEALRDTIRRNIPEADVPPGDRGARVVLRTWIEEEIKNAVGLDKKV